MTGENGYPSDVRVDLRSDTVTRPTAGMRQAMAAATVGDDVLGEDPAVNALQERVARMLGKEAALFVPTGTMANLVAVLAQTRPGDGIILHEASHPLNNESANLTMVAGVLPRPLGGEFGLLDPAAVSEAIDNGADHHHAPTTLVSIENTTNAGGGAVYSPGAVAAVAAAAHEGGLRLHCDGARLFNAVKAAGVTARDYARHVDTLCFCFSKGLGAPAGSIVAGDAHTIDRAHRFRKMLGGGMRQAGVLAAAASYAMDHHIDRLTEDHRRAAAFHETLEDMLAFPLPTTTNIVYVDVADAAQFTRSLAERGVLVLATGPSRIRAVFHLDVDDDGLARAIEAFRAVAAA